MEWFRGRVPLKSSIIELLSKNTTEEIPRMISNITLGYQPAEYQVDTINLGPADSISFQTGSHDAWPVTRAYSPAGISRNLPSSRSL